VGRGYVQLFEKAHGIMCEREEISFWIEGRKAVARSVNCN